MKGEGAPHSEGSGHHYRVWPLLLPCFLLFWLVAIEFCVQGWYRAHERGMLPTQRWKVRWPEGSPGFRYIPIDEGVRQTLRFDEGREASWEIPGENGPTERCFAFFLRWNPGGSSVVRARAHRPDICLPSQGWKQIGDGRVREFSSDSLALSFHRVDFKASGGSAIARTFFCLAEDQRTNEQRADRQLPRGVQPDWSFPARWRAVRSGVRNMGQQIFEVILISKNPDPQSAEAAFAKMLPALIEKK